MKQNDIRRHLGITRESILDYLEKHFDANHRKSYIRFQRYDELDISSFLEVEISSFTGDDTVCHIIFALKKDWLGDQVVSVFKVDWEFDGHYQYSYTYDYIKDNPNWIDTNQDFYQKLEQWILSIVDKTDHMPTKEKLDSFKRNIKLDGLLGVKDKLKYISEV